MDNVYKIYKITNSNNTLCYIGQTIRTLEKRWTRHKSDAKSGVDTFLYRSMRKYGIECFNIEVIAYALKQEFLNDLEILLIAQHNTFTPNGFNLTSGGNANTEISQETRKKLSIASMERRHTGEAKKKMSLAARGNKKGIGNKSRTGHVISKETREKLRITSTGRRHTPEAIEKIRISKMGNKYGLGYKHSEESKKKIGRGRMGTNNPGSRGSVFTPFGVFTTTEEASKYTKCSSSTVRVRCRDIKPQWSGWYYEDQIGNL